MKEKTYLIYIVIIVIIDNLVTQRAKASAAIVMPEYPRN